MPEAITRRAYAKLNLTLAVGPPLPRGHAKAGFHPIASWMASIDLWDQVSVAPLGSGGESRYAILWATDAPRQSPIDWPLEKDLAVRAHRLLEREAGRPLPLKMEVLKRIPVGGGLGGGSSDAAAALQAINSLFKLALSASRLSELGARLGSDVPYFVAEKDPPPPAFVTGLGESVRRLEGVSSGVVLLIPPFGTSSAGVYRAFDSRPTHAVDEAKVQAAISAAGRARVQSGDLFNDLTEAAAQAEPRIAALLDRAQQILGAPVHLSGSGSSMFFLCPEADRDKHAARLQAGLAHQAQSPDRHWLSVTRVVTARLV